MDAIETMLAAPDRRPGRTCRCPLPRRNGHVPSCRRSRPRRFCSIEQCASGRQQTVSWPTDRVGRALQVDRLLSSPCDALEQFGELGAGRRSSRQPSRCPVSRCSCHAILTRPSRRRMERGAAAERARAADDVPDRRGRVRRGRGRELRSRRGRGARHRRRVGQRQERDRALAAAADPHSARPDRRRRGACSRAATC